MIEALIEFKNVKCEKIASLLSKFRGTFNKEFKVWLHDESAFAHFKVASIPELNEFTRRLKRVEKMKFKYRSIKKVVSSRRE
jgi:hypothetical protein